MIHSARFGTQEDPILAIRQNMKKKNVLPIEIHVINENDDYRVFGHDPNLGKGHSFGSKVFSESIDAEMYADTLAKEFKTDVIVNEAKTPKGFTHIPNGVNFKDMEKGDQYIVNGGPMNGQVIEVLYNSKPGKMLDVKAKNKSKVSIAYDKKDYPLGPYREEEAGNKLPIFVKKSSSVNEAKAKNPSGYYPSYSAAVQAGEKYANELGFEVEEDEWFQKVGQTKKPSKGKTVRITVGLIDSKTKKESKKGLSMQVFYDDAKAEPNVYELNCYVS